MIRANDRLEIIFYALRWRRAMVRRKRECNQDRAVDLKVLA